MTFAELEEANVFSSDISALGAPSHEAASLKCDAALVFARHSAFCISKKLPVPKTYKEFSHNI